MVCMLRQQRAKGDQLAARLAGKKGAGPTRTSGLRMTAHPLPRRAVLKRHRARWMFLLALLPHIAKIRGSGTWEYPSTSFIIGSWTHC